MVTFCFNTQQQRAYLLVWTGGNPANRISRPKPRASEKMEGLITNNEDIFFSLPILSVDNRTSEDVYTLICSSLYRYIIRCKRTPEDVKIFFCSSNQCDQIAWGLLLSKPGPQELFKSGAIVPCPPPPLSWTLFFSKQEQYYRCQVTKSCQILLVVSVAYGQGRIQGGRMRDMHPPTSHFQKCFWCIQFFCNFEPLQ